MVEDLSFDGFLTSELLRFRHCGSMLVDADRASREDSRAETASTAQRRLGTWAKRLLHPVARTAFLSAEEAHPLNFKFLADEFVQVHAPCYDVSAEHRRWLIPDAELFAERVVHFIGEEGNLAFVVCIVDEEPIALDALASHTTCLAQFTDWVFTRAPTVMAEIIVLWRHM